MSFDKPYIEEEEEQQLIPLTNQINFFRIDFAVNPEINLAITLALENRARIVTNKGGSYTTWNYDATDKIISMV